MIAYQVTSWFRNTKLQDAQLFLRGDNLATLSKYSGFNPEENVAGIRRADLRYTGTPLPISVTLGFKIVF